MPGVLHSARISTVEVIVNMISEYKIVNFAIFVRSWVQIPLFVPHLCHFDWLTFHI